MQKVIEDAIRRIVAAGKAPGILTTNETLARRHIELGCNFVAVGIDTALLKQATDDLARKFKQK